MARTKKRKVPGASNWNELRKTLTDSQTIRKKSSKATLKPTVKPIVKPQSKENDPVPIDEAPKTCHRGSVTAQDIAEGKRKTKLLTFSSSKTISSDITHRLAIDCEMVGVGPGGTESELARVSVVNVYGDVVYDKLVKPTSHVTDSRSHITGLSAVLLRQNGIPFKEAQREVAGIIKDKIVIGHDVAHDFAALGFSHPRHLIRDTSKYKPFRELSKGNTPSLKNLVRHFLKAEVQNGTHDSIEDARGALQLYRQHRPAWERSLKMQKKRAKAESQAGKAEEEADGLDD